MQHTISKRKIILALMKEPLTRNNFFEERDNPKCKVCAVGAVLRAVNVEQYEMFGHRVTKGRNASVPKPHLSKVIGELLKDKNYLGALSMYHETKSADKTVLGVKHRMKLANFVLKNFPSKLTFDT